MFELDAERTEQLYGARWLGAAAWYRSHALTVVEHPDVVLDELAHPAVMQKIEAEFCADARQRAEMFEVLSYGDAGFLMTTPGPSLSGVLIAAMGDQEQRDQFQHFVCDRRSRTFFAVTEPSRGSDAANLEMRYIDGVLSGEKMLFGNGAVAPLGTVLARTGDGPLDTVALLLTPELLASGAVLRRTLDMSALHGAQLSYLRADRLQVPDALVLGRHLKAVERGMMGLLTTFHRFRPGVAAMAIGHAQALVDYTRRYFSAVTDVRALLDHFDHALGQARSLNLTAAAQVDVDPLRGAVVSLAKQRATAAAERIATALRRQLPAAALVDHPWLTKSLADVQAFEFMEGTTPVQLSNVHNGFLRSEVGV